MSDINFNGYGDEEFFTLFLDAVKETYGEYCTFKEREEDLSGYSEPVFEKSIEEAEQRITSIMKIIPKVTNEAAQQKITADYAKRHLEQCEAALSAEQNKREEVEQQLAKANERVRELEVQLKRLIDYEADQALLPEASYQGTRQLVNDIKNDATDVGGCYEVSCGLLDSLFEHYTDKGASKLLNKFAIEKKIEALKSFASYAKGDDWEDAYLQEAIKIEIEQLRKEQE